MATWYVSKTGNNLDGTSWATAWNELSQIVWANVFGGDTILIDGGAVEMQYTTRLLVGKSGASMSPITIRRATEPGRDGRVWIFGGRSQAIIECCQSSYTLPAGVRTRGIDISGNQWIIVDGMDWNKMYISGFHGPGIRAVGSNLIFRNIEVVDCGEIDNTSSRCAPQWGPADNNAMGVQFGGANILFEQTVVHDCAQDSFQSGGGNSNITWRRCWMYVARKKANGTTFNDCSHADGIQVWGGGTQTGFLIEQCIIGPGFMQGTIFGDPFGSTVCNNVVIRDSLIYGILQNVSAGVQCHGTNPGQPAASTGWVIENCTFDRPDGENWHNVSLLWGGNNLPSASQITIRDSVFLGGNDMFTPTGGAYSGNYYRGITQVTGGFGTLLPSNPFVNPVHGVDSLTADFTISPSSPAVGKGVLTYKSSTQLVGGGATGGDIVTPQPARAIARVQQPTLIPDVSASAPAFIFLTTPVDITPGVSTVWTVADVSTLVPAGATGIAVHFVNSSASSNDVGLRMTGAGVSRINRMANISHFWGFVGVNAARQFEIYIQNITQTKAYLVGYFNDQAHFYATSVNKTPVTRDSWQAVSVAAQSGSDPVIAAIFDVVSATSNLATSAFGARRVGSTHVATSPVDRHTFAIVPVDANEECEIFAGTDVTVNFIGYIKSGLILHSNPIDVTGAIGPSAYSNLGVSSDLVFRFWTRVTTATYPRISAYYRPGDLYWGQITTIPRDRRAFTFGTPNAVVTQPDSFFAGFSNINWDCEYDTAAAGFPTLNAARAAALADSQTLRSWIDGYNSRNPTTTMKFSMFMHLVLIDPYTDDNGNAHPGGEVFQYADEVVFGKSAWGYFGEIITGSAPYRGYAVNYGKPASILLGRIAQGPQVPGGEYVYTVSELVDNFHKVVDPPPNGCGLGIVSFYYGQDLDDTLIPTLQLLRTGTMSIPSGSTGGLYEITTPGSRAYHIRKKGTTEDYYFNAALHPYALVPADVNGDIEAKADVITNFKIWQIGTISPSIVWIVPAPATAYARTADPLIDNLGPTITPTAARVLARVVAPTIPVVPVPPAPTRVVARVVAPTVIVSGTIIAVTVPAGAVGRTVGPDVILYPPATPPPQPQPPKEPGKVHGKPKKGLREYISFTTADGVRKMLHNPPRTAVLERQGLGMPPLEYVTQRGPAQQGESLRNYIVGPRVVHLKVRQNYCDREGYWEGRSNLLGLLSPVREQLSTASPGTLRFHLPDGEKRDLRVVVAEGPSFDRTPGGWDEVAHSDVIRFIAHDPIFFDPEEKSFIFSGGSGALLFPITFPVIFAGLSEIECRVVYDGTWIEYPRITIVGPITLPVITNTVTNEKLDLNTTLVVGQQVDFDLSYGVKTIRRSDGVNMLPYLSDDSDLATFHLAPHPEAPGGVNLITVNGTEASVDTTVTIRWNRRFIGI